MTTHGPFVIHPKWRSRAIMTLSPAACHRRNADSKTMALSPYNCRASAADLYSVIVIPVYWVTSAGGNNENDNPIAFYTPPVPKSHLPRPIQNSTKFYGLSYFSSSPEMWGGCFDSQRGSPGSYWSKRRHLLLVGLFFGLAGKRLRIKEFSERFSQKTFISTFQHGKYFNSPLWKNRFYILCTATIYCFTINNFSRRGARVHNLVAH